MIDSRNLRIINFCLIITILVGCEAKPDPPGPMSTLTTASVSVPSASRGREIYRQGTSPSGRSIRAYLGGSIEPVDAALLACANCHGRDGRGRPEGGIEPPNVTAKVLARADGSTDRWGRHRPAYTESTLSRVVTMGLDPSGRRLETVMPRYQLAAEDLADLVAYLTILGDDLDPGIQSESITIGVLVPPDRVDPSRRRSIQDTSRAYVDDLNRRGGLFNRKIVLESADLDPTLTEIEIKESVEAFIEKRSIFALVAGDIRGFEDLMTRVVESKGVPMIGPSAIEIPTESAWLRHSFFLQTSLGGQVRSMARDAARSGPDRVAALIHSDDPQSIRWLEEFDSVWSKLGSKPVQRVRISESIGVAALEAIVDRLRSEHVEVLVYLGPKGICRVFLESADRLIWRPLVYLPGSQTSPDLLDRPLSFHGRVLLSSPSVPEDMTQAGRSEFDRLRATDGLSSDHLATRMAVLAAWKLFEEGVRRSGRDLSRGALVEHLEQLRDFSTGYCRPLTFGIGRRVGASGAYLLELNLASGQLGLSGGWVEAEAPDR